MLQGGRSFLYDAVGTLLQRSARGETIDMELRARVKLAVTHATDSAAQATEIAYRQGGGTSNYESSLLQRCLRDVNAVTQHFMVAPSNYETVGRVLMGLEPGTPLI
jgi:alkylation response protein AidB-like acyl-CoA dehydrogenase